MNAAAHPDHPNEVVRLEIFSTPAALWVESSDKGFEGFPESSRRQGAVRTRGAVITRGGETPTTRSSPLTGRLTGIDLLWKIQESQHGTELILVTTPTRQGAAPASILFTGPEGDSITREFRLQESVVQMLKNGRNEIAIIRRDGSRLTIFAKVNDLRKGDSQGAVDSSAVLDEARTAVREYLEGGERYVKPDNGILSLGELDQIIALRQRVQNATHLLDGGIGRPATT